MNPISVIPTHRIYQNSIRATFVSSQGSRLGWNVFVLLRYRDIQNTETAGPTAIACGMSRSSLPNWIAAAENVFVQKVSTVCDWLRVCMLHGAYRLCKYYRMVCQSNVHTEFWLWVKKQKSNEYLFINLPLVPLSCAEIIAIYWLIAVFKNYVI